MEDSRLTSLWNWTTEHDEELGKVIAMVNLNIQQITPPRPEFALNFLLDQRKALKKFRARLNEWRSSGRTTTAVEADINKCQERLERLFREKATAVPPMEEDEFAIKFGDSVTR